MSKTKSVKLVTVEISEVVTQFPWKLDYKKQTRVRAERQHRFLKLRREIESVK